MPWAERHAFQAIVQASMKFIPRRLLSSLFAVLLLAFACGAWAQEDVIRRTVETRFGVKVESVKKMPFMGLYEVVILSDEKEIAYTDETAGYLFTGSVFDMKNRRNLTQERLDKLTAIKFEDLPLELAIKQVKGNGKRVVAVFADPFCPFCRQLDQSLAKMDDVTIYTFMYPILRPNESPEMASRIWCSPDRSKAYLDLMLHNRAPSKVAACVAPVDKWMALGKKLNIQATPVSYVTTGNKVVGARFDDLQRAMDEAAAQKR